MLTSLTAEAEADFVAEDETVAVLGRALVVAVILEIGRRIVDDQLTVDHRVPVQNM